MPSYFEKYQKRLGSHTNGEARKIESDKIIEWSWNEDLQSKVGYFYDYYMDDQPLEYKNLNSRDSKTKVPIDVKFITNSYNSDNKDQVSYHIQFRPSFRWEDNKSLEFYKERFVEKYDAEYPIGCYVDLPDEKGNYRKWLVTENANWLDNQFPTWSILPCDHLFQWIHKGVKYQICGVSRSQNS